MNKNHLFAILHFVLISVFFASCSSEGYQVAEFEELQEAKFVDSKLIKDLTNINEDLLANRIETRKGWTGKQRCCIYHISEHLYRKNKTNSCIFANLRISTTSINFK